MSQKKNIWTQRAQERERGVQKCSYLPKIWLFISLYSDFPFPYFLRISIFLQGNCKELGWDGVYIKYQESKFSAVGKCKTHLLFLKAHISSVPNQMLRNLTKNHYQQNSWQVWTQMLKNIYLVAACTPTEKGWKDRSWLRPTFPTAPHLSAFWGWYCPQQPHRAGIMHLHECCNPGHRYFNLLSPVWRHYTPASFTAVALWAHSTAFPRNGENKGKPSPNCISNCTLIPSKTQVPKPQAPAVDVEGPTEHRTPTAAPPAWWEATVLRDAGNVTYHRHKISIFFF